jgi:hypothetical protein
VVVVVDDTHLKLQSAYAGITGSAAPIKSKWIQETASGGSISIVSSEAQLISGTSNGAVAKIYRLIDYSPLIIGFYVNISQRIVNQEIKFGACDDPSSPINYALIVFDGVDDTKCYLRTGSASGDVETSSVFTLPNNINTSAGAWYKLEITQDIVSLYCNGILLGSNKLHIPDIYLSLNICSDIVNTGIAASSTTVYIDVAQANNLNILSISGGSIDHPVPVYSGGTDNNGEFRFINVKNTVPLTTDYGSVVRPLLTTAGSVSHGSVTTSAAGSSFVTLSSISANQLTMINNSGKDVEVRRNGAGAAIPVFDGSFWTFRGISNADQLSLRRIDQSNVQVTVHYEVES